MPVVKCILTDLKCGAWR